MKNILYAIGIVLLLVGSAYAQTNSLDKKLQNVNQAAVTSGIIYDRVLPLADLCIYNMPADKAHNTADFKFFNKALSELHKASNYTKLISTTKLKQLIIPYNNEMNIVPIGIINTPFQTLNFNPENFNESGLVYKDSLFAEVAGKAPFFNGYAMVVAPLKNVMQGAQIIFKFNEDLIFNNGDVKIKTLNADFGDGTSYKIIENGIIIKREVIIENFKDNGDKKFRFTVELTNTFTFFTNGSIYTVYGNDLNRSSTPQPVACSSNILGAVGAIDNFSINYTEAADTFQGFNESAALKAQIESRVFYRTNNSNTQKTLLKPIIIVDGFDPSDGRKIDDCDCERDPVCAEEKKDVATGIYNPNNHMSFVESMKYTDNSTVPVFEKNLISVLRLQGYDVILVNQPTYTTTSGVRVDGGADFIERNAKAFATLVQEVNTKLQTNGSSEKLVILGPSMGGQITRYALALMEKKFAETGLAKWQHNTRIWVAFDSPNHGANVPLGSQALIKMLASAEVNLNAQKSFDKLQSIAANEMLINYFKVSPAVDNLIFNNHYFNVDVDNTYNNASTTSQGMSASAGNPYFQEHYNNQFNNGLPNSNGFPVNLRKLAIVNGSLSGATFGNGYEKTLDIRLFKTIRLINWNIFGWQVSSIFHSKLFQAETYSMPTSNNVIARTEKLRADDGNDKHVINAFANSIRGNMDNVPGGSIDVTGQLHTSITGQAGPGPRSFWQFPGDSGGSFYYNHIGFAPEWETHAYKPVQCFIPTYSGIGIKNPNQSWSNPLNRNLACSNETYFDSYFGEANNTSHVELNYRSVNWLLKELGSTTAPPTPQAPSFPIDPAAFSGPSTFCENSAQTYQFNDLCKIPGKATFTVTGNIVINSFTDYAVTVQSINGGGAATITADFGNGQPFTKTIWVGVPQFSAFNFSPSGNVTCIAPIDFLIVSLPSQTVTSIFNGQATNEIQSAANFEWVKENNLIMLNGTNNKRSICPMFEGFSSFKVRAKNICGWSDWTEIPQFEITAPPTYNQRQANTNFYTVYPNPSKDIVNIDLRDANNQPEKNTVILGELFDIMGLQRAKVKIIDNKATFSVQGLNKGIYILKIYLNNQVEAHQIAVE